MGPSKWPLPGNGLSTQPVLKRVLPMLAATYSAHGVSFRARRAPTPLLIRERAAELRLIRMGRAARAPTRRCSRSRSACRACWPSPVSRGGLGRCGRACRGAGHPSPPARAVALEGRFSGIAAVGARRIEVLVLVLEVVALRHRLPPIQVPFPARLLPNSDGLSRTMRTGGASPGTTEATPRPRMQTHPRDGDRPAACHCPPLRCAANHVPRNAAALVPAP